jgi:hypothetical protein
MKVQTSNLILNGCVNAAVLGKTDYRYRNQIREAPNKEKSSKKLKKMVEVENDGKKKIEDCLECKLIGSGTMLGLSAYFNMIRMQSKNRNHRLFYGVIVAGNLIKYYF